MTEADLPEVLAIENLSFPIPFSEKLYRMELQLEVAHLYVVRSERKIIGYIDFWRIGPEMHVISIAVHPDWRQHGIGGILIDLLIKEGKRHSVEKISLDVRPSNQAGLTLYKKYGFEQVGIRKSYYQDNQEDALLFSLSLNHLLTN